MVEFWWSYAWPTLWIVIQILFLVLPLLIVVAYLTYAERKVIGLMQLRMGPNVVGPFGLFQPFADALKLMTKELIIPTGANRVVFLLAPMLTFILAMVGWAVIPVAEGCAVGHQCRRAVPLRDFLARRVRHHHGRLGLELEISVPRRAALGGTDGVL